jgi:hypothetical protein
MEDIAERLEGQVWGEAVLVHLDDSREFNSTKNTLSCLSQVNILRTTLDFSNSPLFGSAIMPTEYREKWEEFIKYFLEIIVIPIYRESLSFRWELNELMCTLGGQHAYNVVFDLKNDDGGESTLNAFFIAIGSNGTQMILLRADKREYNNRFAEFRNMLQSLSYWGGNKEIYR